MGISMKKSCIHCDDYINIGGIFGNVFGGLVVLTRRGTLLWIFEEIHKIILRKDCADNGTFAYRKASNGTFTHGRADVKACKSDEQKQEQQQIRGQKQAVPQKQTRLVRGRNIKRAESYLNESKIFLPVGCLERNDLSAGLRMSNNLPSTRAIWRSIRDARSGLCVAIRAVIPWVWTRLVRVSKTDSELYGSRLPVGSSANKRCGLFAMDLAMATRCCSPPESSDGLWKRRCESPTESSFSRAIVDADLRE